MTNVNCLPCKNESGTDIAATYHIKSDLSGQNLEYCARHLGKWALSMATAYIQAGGR